MGHEYNSEDFECIVKRDDASGGWIAEYADFPGVRGCANDKFEALRAAEETLTHWLENATAVGIKIPKPGEVARITGQFKIRLPKSFHRELARVADGANISMNELVLQLLTAAVSRAITGQTKCSLPCSNLRVASRTDQSAVATDRSYNGVWIQRAPRTLHLHLQNIAENEGVTLNSLVLYMLGLEFGSLLTDKAALKEQIPSRAKRVA